MPKNRKHRGQESLINNNKYYYYYYGIFPRKEKIMKKIKVWSRH